MKKNNLIATSAAAIVALVAITGVSIMTYASSTDDTTNTTTTEKQGRGMMGKNFDNLTDEEKATMEAERQARQAEMEARKEATDKAIEAGDYTAWVTAAGEDCPMLEKINEGNFARFAEMHKLREQADAIAQELGIEKGGHKGEKGKMGGPEGCMNK